MIKFLGIDMDGTCLDSNTKILPETKEKIIEAINKGVTVVPTTGRALGVVPKEILEIPGIEYVITSNGAVINDIKNDEVIYRQSIPNYDLQEIRKILDNYDTFVDYLIDNVDYVSEEDFKNFKDVVPEHYWELYETDVKVIPNDELEALLDKGENVEKVQVRLIPRSPEDEKEFFKAVNALPETYLFGQAEGTIEISSIDATKSEAQAALTNHLGIDCTQVMAIGDSNNDIPMIAFAEIGVAMGQASDRVKSYADYITTSNDDNGVAHAIDRFIIHGEKESDNIPKELVEKVKEANK